MSLPALVSPSEEEFEKLSLKKTAKLHGSETHSLRSKKKTNPKKKSESELRAAKEREEKLLQLYDLWIQVKQDEREIKHQYFKERIALQHELIQKQDILLKQHQTKKDARDRKEKESNRLSKLAQLKHYTDFVKDALAEEKLQKISLKSQARIVSSHQPTRAPRPSIYTCNSPPKAGEIVDEREGSCSKTDDMAAESILLSDNFNELLHESVDVQLHTLLGEEALDFLHPTFREGAKKSLDPLIDKYKTGGIGAYQLWSTLRGRSQRKLEKEDGRIPQELKNSYRSFLRECLHSDVPVIERSFCKVPEEVPEEKLTESHLIKDINFARHRLDLMFRVAHMNRDKTRLLFKNMESVDTKDGSVRPPRYNPNQIKNPRVSLLALQSSLPSVPENSETENKKSPREEKDELVVLGSEKLVFLTEKMATCKGEFSKRHNAAGSGNDDPTPQNVKQETTRSRFRSVVSAPISSQGQRIVTQTPVKTWQPLSLNALIEYKKPIGVGSGEFLQGQSRKWKVDVDDEKS